MYFGKKFLKILYGKLSSLYTDDNKNKDGTTFVSALRYFFATDEFIKKNNRAFDVNNSNDKTEFTSNVGRMVLLSNIDDKHAYRTVNFGNKFNEEKDFDVSSNFYTAGAVLRSLSSSDIFTYPQRNEDDALLSIEKGIVSIYADGYKHIAENQKWLGRNQVKFAILFVWLNRYTAFQSIQTAYDDFLKKLKNIYSNELIKALKWETDDVKKEVINLISDADVSEEQVFIEKSDFEQSNVKYDTVDIPHPHNRIVFGAPGTGKSHLLKEESELFINQTFVSTNIIQAHLANCTTKGDYIKLGSLYQDELKNMSVSQIAESYNKTNAYWIKKGATYGLPTIIKDEELPEDIEDTLKSIPHGKQETESMKIGYEYCNYFDGKPIDEIKNLYQCSSTVASWISYGAEAAMSQVGTVEKPIKFLERVTFHPNYSYAQFVGTYKPVKSKENSEEITYEYVPGPFMRVYVNAVKNTGRKFLLLIEEINRANVAAVFGDVFQLLDRKADGTSQYPITASEDQKNYLKSCGINEDEISIPANMYIWATMNSADQGVLPMDAAFKRRWDFEYIGIDENEDKVADIKIPVSLDGKKSVLWNDFRKKLNEKLSDELKINEDKLLGPFFLSKKSLENAMAEPERFVKLFESKVIMYLFEDVVKMQPAKLFKCDKLRYSEICKEFESNGMDVFGIDVEVFDM